MLEQMTATTLRLWSIWVMQCPDEGLQTALRTHTIGFLICTHGGRRIHN